jgi:pyruvate,water dikinase
MKYILPFADPRALTVDAAGGKGANLAFMTQHGLPVPGGCVIHADAYRDFVRQQAWLQKAADRLPVDDPAALRSACGTIIERLAQVPVPEGLRGELEAWLAGAGPDLAWSVRSSATLEDTATAAFAGQHETFLNVRGLDELVAKIKSCWLSLWADRAARYRHQLGFRHTDATMAVVVQQMAFCDVSGVGFTINPIAGRVDQMILDANYGLGESVVSGEAAVDHWTVEKTTGEVIEEVIGEKATRTVPVEGGVREEEVPAKERAVACLDAARLKTIIGLLGRIEDAYQFPQDVEWGFIGAELLILQSRPITTIPDRWTRDESAERFPTVITPLTWDLVEEGFHRSLNYSFHLMGFPPYDGKWFGLKDHYVYGNQNAVEIYGRRVPIRLDSVDDLRKAIPVLRQQYGWVQELPVTWLRDLDRYLLAIGRLMAEPLGDRDLAGVWRYVLEVNQLGSDYFQPNIAISITQGTLYRVLLGFLKLVFGEAEAPGKFDQLMAFCETKTGAINKELFELAKEAENEPELAELLANRASKEILESGRLDGFPGFKATFDTFLRNHGHREIEFDAYHPTWAEAPWVVLDNIRLAMGSGGEMEPARRQEELKAVAQHAEFECLKALPEDLHFLFHELVRLARTYTSLDDLEHYQTTRLTLPLRRGLRELGGRLVRIDVIDEPMDVFFAGAEALDRAIREHRDELWRDLRTAIREEKAAYLADKARTPDWVLGEAAEPLPEGEFLSGLPGSPGSARGPVFLVHGPEDFASFPKGAVLVARTTNPTWTPLFYNAAAVVTESGGPLSHGAVIAREMKIPAVTSVRGVLGVLTTGQEVTVDGTGGKVFPAGR